MLLGMAVPVLLFHFNPRTRVGCDPLNTRASRLGRISIHAPGWGATISMMDALQRMLISIHAPGWGATEECESVAAVWDDFNPRTRVGCDLR